MNEERFGPGQGHGPGGGKRRGRPRVRRNMASGAPPGRCFDPCCHPDHAAGIVTLSDEELEAMKLVDLDGLNQEQAAASIGVSRKTLWRDLHEARGKVVDALVHGKSIRTGSCGMEFDLCPHRRRNG